MMSFELTRFLNAFNACYVSIFLYLLLEKLENELYPCHVSLHTLLLINITYTQVAPLKTLSGCSAN